MALLGKKKTASQKHSIIEVIKYDGPNDVLIWKYPNEDFNTNTQLIVGPAQEAIFVKGGQVLGRFESGTHTLSTKNYPFIRSLVSLVTGGISPFSCIVYYINKVDSMGIDWGTDTPISIVDPVYKVPIDIRSYGDLSLRVENGQRLLEKLVGQTRGYSQQEIKQYFSNLMATQVRGVISGTMAAHNLSPIGIDAYLADMSKYAMERISPIFEPYGMAVNHFTIAAITAPELDTIKRKARALQEHRMETDVGVEDKKKRAQAQAFENQALGINEQQKMVGSAMETLATNAGPVVTPGIGIVGVAMPNGNGGTVIQPAAAGATEMARLLLEQQSEPQSSEPQDSFTERAKKLKTLHDLGMISDEEYRSYIQKLLDEATGRS